MRLGLYSAVAAVAFTVPQMAVLVRGVHIDRSPLVGADLTNLAQMSAQAKSKISTIDKEIRQIRSSISRAENERKQLESARDTDAKGRDTYSDLLDTVQHKLDDYEEALNSEKAKIKNREDVIDAYYKQIEALQVQEKEIRQGGTIHLQVPVMHSSTQGGLGLQQYGGAEGLGVEQVIHHVKGS